MYETTVTHTYCVPNAHVEPPPGELPIYIYLTNF